MHIIQVRTFEEWRAAARPSLAARTPPGEIVWGDSRTPLLFESRDTRSLPAMGEATVSISRGLLKLLEEISHYRDGGRWELMYRLAWRSLSNRALLEDQADPDVSQAMLMSKAIHRDVHKMHAFVRFRETTTNDGEMRYVAWFEPAHEILRLAAPFFEKRFPNMKWMIATPDGAAVWNGDGIRYIEAPARSTLPQADDHEGLWRTYYRNICNVARINTTAMQREMPKRYWHYMPETSEISGLLHEGAVRLERKAPEASLRRHSRLTPDAPSSDSVVDDKFASDPLELAALGMPAPQPGAQSRPADLANASLATSQGHMPRGIADALARIAVPADTPFACRRCDLWKRATQPVVGEGAEHASVMLVGEQPGDEEDLRGRPFVGPAGRLLDQILVDAGIARGDLFITNAVKHFKWEPRGKRRLHKRPDVQEISACNVWLDQEILRVTPRVIVALGATAARSLTGSTRSIESSRGEILQHPSGARLLVSYHPSAILRAEGERATQLRAALTQDLLRAMSLSGEALQSPVTAPHKRSAELQQG